tara:strand:- start:44 stop:1054 length:1011 start_codon:yes stop_codon:yes gene_type:complete
MAYTTIDNPELYFQTKLYSGTGSSLDVTLDGDEDMSPNLVWIKRRTNASDKHVFYDTGRGVQKRLMTSESDAEDTQAQHVTAFNSDGFTVGTGGAVNTSSETFIAWCWDESADAGFDIVTHVGTSSAHTISHSLSAVPKFIISKSRTSDAHWGVYHASLGATKFIDLNRTAASDTQTTPWNDTTPTSSVFTVGTGYFKRTNESSDNFVCYLFAEKQGFSKFGSYTGNGNATDGPYIYTGFQPAWLMVKRAVGGTGNWMVVDNKRPGYNHGSYYKYDFKINNTDAERTTVASADFFSNGFKVRTDSTDWNVDGDTYIYIAFANSPFVNSNGVPCNAR